MGSQQVDTHVEHIAVAMTMAVAMAVAMAWAMAVVMVVAMAVVMAVVMVVNGKDVEQTYLLLLNTRGRCDQVPCQIQPPKEGGRILYAKKATSKAEQTIQGAAGGDPTAYLALTEGHS